MKTTVYRNASGLPNDEQITSARDQAILTMAMIRDFPAYYPLFSTQEFVYGGRINTNHNRMLGWYNGAEGLKTGYVNASGYNIILTAKRDERRLIGVMMGGDSAQARDNAIAALMDGAFNGTSSLVASNDKLAPAPKTNGTNVVPVMVASNTPAWTPINKDPIGTRIAAIAPAAPAASPAHGNSVPLAGKTNVALTSGGKNGADTWAMQVGAYGDTGAARNAIATAQINLPDLRATPSIAPIDSKGRTLYRARLSGLTQGEASIGCRRLQDQGSLDCTAVKVDPSDIDVAAN
jgi:D-alanyl-D-alanine carboxypeptidase